MLITYWLPLILVSSCVRFQWKHQHFKNLLFLCLLYTISNWHDKLVYCSDLFVKCYFIFCDSFFFNIFFYLIAVASKHFNGFITTIQTEPCTHGSCTKCQECRKGKETVSNNEQRKEYVKKRTSKANKMWWSGVSRSQIVCLENKTKEKALYCFPGQVQCHFINT